MSERKIPSFLCHKTFDDEMLEKFHLFYAKCMADGAKDAIIYINSPGGYVWVANSMLSMMENTDIKFHTACVGCAASCGLLLLAGGDVRYATERADIMFHDIGGGNCGHPDQIEEYVKRMKVTSQRVMEKFAKKTKKPLKWWMAEYMKNPNRQLWFDGKRAKTLGVVEHVGLPVEIVKAAAVEPVTVGPSKV